MSTKIYSGIRFVPTDLVTIHEHFLEWRKRVAELTHKTTVEWMIRNALVEVDGRIARGEEPMKGALFGGLLKLWDKQEEVRKTQHRNPAVDFEFNVSVLPWQGRVYGIVFTEQREWLREFMELPWIEDYSYWDNTDEPEEITREDWDDRGVIWDAIMAQDPWGRPVGCGFTVECHAPEYAPTMEEILPHVPSLDERAERAAKEIVSNRAFAREINLFPEEDRKTKAWAAMKSAGAYLATNDGQAEIILERDRIKPLLPQEARDFVKH